MYLAENIRSKTAVNIYLLVIMKYYNYVTLINVCNNDSAKLAERRKCANDYVRFWN